MKVHERQWFVAILLIVFMAGCGGGGGGSDPLSAAKAITAFSFESPAATGTIDANAKTIAVTVPYGTNVTALVAMFNTTGVSVNVGSTAQVSRSTVNDFTGPVAYTVTAADSTTATYTVTVTVAAITPTINLPKTGQTSCTDSTGSVISCATTTGAGQDGALQKGVSVPGMRFTPVSSGTGTVVTDNLTGLIWAGDGGTPTFDICTAGTSTLWQNALDYVACLNTKNYLGYSDWRLPNRKEMRSLVNYGQSSTVAWLNTQGFTNVQNVYWSSTSISGANTAWFISMLGGNIGIAVKAVNPAHVLPVRAGQGSGALAELPKTGQTLCSDSTGTIISCATTTAAGQDGALQKGVEWPSPRFKNADNSTPISGDVVVDHLTGLMWTKDSNAPGPACTPAVTKNWQDALDYVACLNTNSYLGYADWRLPNVNELESLVNAGQSDTAAWLDTQGFTTVGGYYWSSTTYPANNAYAVYVNMNSGTVGASIKDSIVWYVWPVRGGQ